MHEVIRTALDPTTALSFGLSVDVAALPAAVVVEIQNGSVDLRSPATTVALLKLNAVVGLKGTVETVHGTDVPTRVGVTCTLCHATVDNSFAPASASVSTVGRIATSTPARSLRCRQRSAPQRKPSTNPGGPASTTRVQPRRQEWPAGHPARLRLGGNQQDHLDRRWQRPCVLEALCGRDADVRPRYVCRAAHRGQCHQWHGRSDHGEASRAAGVFLSLAAPPPPSGSLDAAAADRGKLVFNNAGKCVTCHSGTEFTDVDTRLQRPSDAVSEPEPGGAPSYASRSATKQCRTAPLKGGIGGSDLQHEASFVSDRCPDG